MPIQQLVQCTLETIGRPKQSRYEGKPDYRPVLFKLSTGEHKWKSYNVGALELEWLKRGNAYQAVVSGDDFNIIQPDTATATPAPDSVAPQQPTANAPQLSIQQKQAIASYVGDMGDLYAYCLNQAQEKIGASCDAETVRCMASSLFIAASRKFDL